MEQKMKGKEWAVTALNFHQWRSHLLSRGRENGRLNERTKVLWVLRVTGREAGLLGQGEKADLNLVEPVHSPSLTFAEDFILLCWKMGYNDPCLRES